MNPPVTTTALRPGLLTGVATAAVAVAVGAILALLGGAGDPLSAARTGVRGWLALQGAGLDTGTAAITLVPLGGVVVCAALTARVTRRFLPDPVDAVGPFAAVVAGMSGVVAAVLASLTSTGDLTIDPVRAAAAAFVVNGVGAALGATLPHGRGADLVPAGRADVRAVLLAAGRGATALLLASTAVLVVMLLAGIDRASQLWALLNPGFGGTVPLALLCLLAIPTAVLWTASVLIGPGFALGVQTSVDLSGAQLGPVPGFPVLAALPSPGAFSDLAIVLGLVPVLAGAVAGFTLVPPDRWAALWPRIGLGAGAGAVAGLAVGLLVGVSGGSVGPGRLAEAGPSMLWPALVAVPVLALGGALGAAAAHYRDHRGESSGSGSADEAARRPRLRFRHQPAGADRGDAGS